MASRSPRTSSPDRRSCGPGLMGAPTPAATTRCAEPTPTTGVRRARPLRRDPAAQPPRGVWVSAPISAWAQTWPDLSCASCSKKRCCAYCLASSCHPGCEPEFAAMQQLGRRQDIRDLMLRLTRENLPRRYRRRRPSWLASLSTIPAFCRPPGRCRHRQLIARRRGAMGVQVGSMGVQVGFAGRFRQPPWLRIACHVRFKYAFLQVNRPKV